MKSRIRKWLGVVSVQDCEDIMKARVRGELREGLDVLSAGRQPDHWCLGKYDHLRGRLGDYLRSEVSKYKNEECLTFADTEQFLDKIVARLKDKQL